MLLYPQTYQRKLQIKLLTKIAVELNLAEIEQKTQFENKYP